MRVRYLSKALEQNFNTGQRNKVTVTVTLFSFGSLQRTNVIKVIKLMPK